MTMTTTPAEFDAHELELMKQRDQLAAQAEQIITAAHRTAGDTYRWTSRTTHAWQLTDEEAIEQAGATEPLARVRYGIKTLAEQIAWCEDFYRANPWNRYFPCLNTDGHIHSSERGCSIVQWTTDMGWATEMSGQDVATAVANLGETLCSVCFPDAPARWCRTRSEVTRAEREAARDAKNAARDAKRAVKELAEPFICHDGDRERTVAALKTIVRRAAETGVELEWARGEDAKGRWENMPDRYEQYIRNIERRLAGEQDDARRANNILIDRECAAPGTGWTHADADKAVAGTVRRTRKAYFG
jgi:hypothetical protein